MSRVQAIRNSILTLPITEEQLLFLSFHLIHCPEGKQEHCQYSLSRRRLQPPVLRDPFRGGEIIFYKVTENAQILS